MNVHIDKNQILKLRKATMLGISKCREALIQANGNYDTAIELLRKEGQKIANKRANMEMHQGRIFMGVHKEKKYGIMFMLHSETDFAANSEPFIHVGETVLKIALDHHITNEKNLFAFAFTQGSLQEILLQLSGQLKENIALTNYVILEGPLVGCYLHTGSKLGAIVSLNQANIPGCNLTEVAKNVALQIVASDPIAIDAQDIPADVLKKEEEIIRAYRLKQNVGANIEMIIKKEIEKFVKENTLLPQPFIKNEKQTIADLLKQESPTLAVVAFKRMQVR